MQQQMIELECPSCQAVLELDAGFAGGVCRCSNCGTLMTVPADPQMVGESLDRPDRPDTPGASAAFSVAVQESTTSEDDSPTADRPESPANGDFGSAVLDELIASTRPETPSRPEPSSTPRPTPAKPTQPKPPEPAESPESKAAPALPKPADRPTPKPIVVQPEIITTTTDEQGRETFVTASGKKVMLAVNAIPVAKVKRKVVRGGIYAIAAVVLIAVIGGTLAAVFALSAMNTGDSNTTADVSRRGYDPNVNPFTDPGANFLGLPLTSRTVILVDASSYSRQWIGGVIEAAIHTVRYEDRAAAVQFIFQSGGNAETYPEQPTALAGISRAEFEQFVNGVRSSGSGEVTAMVQKALENAPRQIIVVTSQPIPDNAVRTLTQLMDAHRSVRLDMVMINTIATDHAQQLVDLVKSHNGEVISLPARRIDTWLDAAGPLEPIDDSMDENEPGKGDANP